MCECAVSLTEKSQTPICNCISWILRSEREFGAASKYGVSLGHPLKNDEKAKRLLGWSWNEVTPLILVFQRATGSGQNVTPPIVYKDILKDTFTIALY